MGAELERIIDGNDLILITGAGGFIGRRVVATLLDEGYSNLRCFMRPSGDTSRLERAISGHEGVRIEIIHGNLLSAGDAEKAMQGVSVAYHLAAGFEKTFPGCFMNSALATRNLLDAAVATGTLKRFVNVSSFAVYSNVAIRRGGLLDESCELESHVMERHEPYSFGKVEQEKMVREYGARFRIPYVILRPGAAYGPGDRGITGRVGIDTFGVFLHLGGSNRIPLTYVDNCAEAIVLAGLVRGVEGEVFNVVDDDLPTSRAFLRGYKKHVRSFRSFPIPYPMLYGLCYLWEKYSKWSEGQLPPAFNRRRCSAYWKSNRYSNDKLKRMLGWQPKVSLSDAWRRMSDFEAARAGKGR